MNFTKEMDKNYQQYVECNYLKDCDETKTKLCITFPETCTHYISFRDQCKDTEKKLD